MADADRDYLKAEVTAAAARGVSADDIAGVLVRFGARSGSADDVPDEHLDAAARAVSMLDGFGPAGGPR